MDYYSEPRLKGKELRELINLETIWILENFVGDGLPGLNAYFKLFANLLWLEEDYENNREDIAYMNGMIGAYIGAYAHPPNGEEIGIYYLQKAIALSENSEEI